MLQTNAPRPMTGNRASVVLRAGPVRLSAKVRLSTPGLLSVGGLVSGILLSTTALVWVATGPVRRHPVASRLARR